MRRILFIVVLLGLIVATSLALRTRARRGTRGSRSEAEQNDVWNEIGQALREFESPAGFVGPCELVLAAGTK